jgi:hypothetical protein
VTSAIAVQRLDAYLESTGISQTEFARDAGTTDRTIRSFRKTRKVRRDIFEGIASAMHMDVDKLITPE